MREGLKDLVPELSEEAWDELPRADSISIRLDANAEKKVRDLFASIQNKLKSLFPDATLRKWTQAMVGDVNRVSKKNTVRIAKAADKDLEIEPLLKDGKLNPFFQNVIDENVGLIRSIPEEKLSSFKNKLVSAIQQDMPQSEIREMIQSNFKVSRSRARLIARDQTNKLNGRLNQYRQQQIGGERYVWNTVSDERVREDHARLDGKIFSWDKPPIVDRGSGRREHPGQDFQCRCFATAILSDLID